MRKNIYNKLLVLVLALSINIIFIGCNNQLNKEVVETYDDGSPKTVSFYNISNKDKEVVKEIQYYKNGQKRYVGLFEDGKRNGKWFFWFKNGNKWSEGYFIAGVRTGKTKVYQENGKLLYTGEYLNGKKHGVWKFYNKEGDKTKVVSFESGKKVKTVEEK